jgi:hypothetical protein
MDPQPADYIRHRLVRFRDAIEETREHYRNLSAFGRYYAGAPYYEKSGILVLLDGLKSEPGIREELCAEFRQCLKKLEALEEERGDDYRAQLRCDLKLYTDTYAAAVCHAHLGSIRFESDHDLFRRDLIIVLVHELERDHDLTELKNLLRVLDGNLFVPQTPADQTGIGIPARTPDRLPGDSDQSPVEN